MVSNTTKFYRCLTELKFTNNMIQQRIREINSRINQQKIDNNRTRLLVLKLSDGNVMDLISFNLIKV